MNIYYCKICKQRGKIYSGTRIMVRKHLREEHFVRGKAYDNSGATMPSQLTADTIVVEIR